MKKNAYIIADENIAYCKIVMSKDIKSRLENLQSSCPLKLKILCKVEPYNELKISFYDRFSEYRIHSEWFKVEGRLKECLDRFKK